MTAMNHDARVVETIELFRAACRRENYWLSGDDRCSEATAARLLGLAEGSLKNLRWAGDGPAFYKSGIHGSKLTYRLSDLARWVEARRCG